jgi:hypothetical protein
MEFRGVLKNGSKNGVEKKILRGFGTRKYIYFSSCFGEK